MFTKNRRRTSLFSESSYRRRRSKVPTSWLIGAIPAGLLLLELLLRLGVGLAGKGAELNDYMGEPRRITDYRLKAHGGNFQPIEGIPNYGRLSAFADPLVGYRLQNKQLNQSLAISPAGFRTDAAIGPKYAKEVRILLLGGSSAFGSLASNNRVTFAAQLEERLNQQVQNQKKNSAQFRPDVLPYFADEVEKVMKLPAKIRDVEYRVINAAVPGYISSNTLADYSSRLIKLKPDLVIVMDGYGDLLMSEAQSAATLPIDNLSSNPLGHVIGSIREMVNGFFNHLYLTKALRYWVLKPKPQLAQVVDGLNPATGSLTDRLPTDPGIMKARVDRYQQNLQNLAILTNATKTPVIVAIQPELSQRKSDKLTPQEQQTLTSLGQPYKDRMQSGYQGLKQAIEAVKKSSGNVSSLLIQPEFDKFNGPAFQDTIHLTDEAQKVVSDKLYDTIVPRFQTNEKLTLN
jgi:hypothetical protein